MTFDSSNRKMLESETTDGLSTIIRTAMEQGCIHPSHVYDAVDEALDRLKKNEELLTRILEYLVNRIKDGSVDETLKASDLADDVWDAIHKGDANWREVHKRSN